MRGVSQVVVALGLVLIAVMAAAIASPLLASLAQGFSKSQPPQIATSKIILLHGNAMQGGSRGVIIRVIATAILPTDYPSAILVCPLVPVFNPSGNPRILVVAQEISSGGWCRSIPNNAGSYRTDFSIFIPYIPGYTYSDPSNWLVGLVDPATGSIIHAVAPIYEVA
jgi:hypothetical protein